MHQPLIRRSGRALRLAVSDQRQQHGHDHEHDGTAEHQMRQVLVHDPAEQQRRQDTAEIESGGDDAKGSPGGARRGGNVTIAITSTMAALIAKQAAATWPWRWVWSARKPPARTPTALAPRNAVS